MTKKNTIGVKLNFVIELFYFGLIDQTKLSPMCPESNCSKQKQKLLKEHTEKAKNRTGQEKKTKISCFLFISVTGISNTIVYNTNFD